MIKVEEVTLEEIDDLKLDETWMTKEELKNKIQET